MDIFIRVSSSNMRNAFSAATVIVIAALMLAMLPITRNE